MANDQHRQSRRLPKDCRRAQQALIGRAAGDDGGGARGPDGAPNIPHSAPPHGAADWLDEHLAECGECARYAARLAGVARALCADRPAIPAEAEPRPRPLRLGWAFGAVAVAAAIIVAAVAIGRPQRPAPLDTPPVVAIAPETVQPTATDEAVLPEAPALPEVGQASSPVDAGVGQASRLPSASVRPARHRPARPIGDRRSPRDPNLVADAPDTDEEELPEPASQRMVIAWQTAEGELVAWAEVPADIGPPPSIPAHFVTEYVEQTPEGTITEVIHHEAPVVVTYWTAPSETETVVEGEGT